MVAPLSHSLGKWEVREVRRQGVLGAVAAAELFPLHRPLSLPLPLPAQWEARARGGLEQPEIRDLDAAFHYPHL